MDDEPFHRVRLALQDGRGELHELGTADELPEEGVFVCSDRRCVPGALTGALGLYEGAGGAMSRPPGTSRWPAIAHKRKTALMF